MTETTNFLFLVDQLLSNLTVPFKMCSLSCLDWNWIVSM
jgi:hypothetical protein